MFKFAFSSDENHDGESTNKNPNTNKPQIKEIQSKQINCDENLIENLIRNCEINSYEYDPNIVIQYVSCVDVISFLKTEDVSDLSVLNADKNHSDLLPGIYEGGLKIWECTYDLIEYMKTSELDFKKSKILDLGCGAGLFGILGGLQGAEECVFQDYNSEVIQYITIPNVHLNKIKNCRFYYGDWLSFHQLLINESKFDFIFTSETIYSIDNYKKLSAIFQDCLSPTGTILLAAKSHYFGVGGGIPQFINYLERTNKFVVETCWKCKDGVKREILKIKLKQ